METNKKRKPMKKIMFNDKYALTKAVLESRKTQTRRIVKTSDAFERVNPDFDWDEEDIKNWEDDFVLRVKNMSETERKECFNYLLNHPKYKVGEIVAVAQSYKDVDSYYSAAYQRQHSIHGMTVDALDCVPNEDIKKWFKNRNDFKDKASWNNKMFVKSELMPHQICITNVKIEQLQDISEEDCLKEGLEWDGVAHKYYVNYDKTNGSKIYFKASPKESYAELIDKVSGKGTWESNPYVFVYEFNLIK